MKRGSLFIRLTWFASFLALCVVVLGAYVRLSDAGLGCPDWPGCYGKLLVPSDAQDVIDANRAFPERLLEAAKAWKEMAHRYLASLLGLVILIMAILAWRRRRKDTTQPVVLPTLLLILVIFQGMLGMWTVTIKLNPTIVMSHLMGGLMTMALLWWLSFRQSNMLHASTMYPSKLHPLQRIVVLGIVIVVLQIFLGGWTSSNYAALHCPDFPTCQGQWLPPMDFKEAFTMWRGTEIDFEGGVLANDARVTIHVMHRLGAVLVLLYIGWLAMKLMTNKDASSLRALGAVLLAALTVQLSLGVANVLLSLPLPVAVAHNAGGAILLLILVAINHSVRPQAGVF